MKVFKKTAWNGAITRLIGRTTEIKAIVQDLIEMGNSHYLTTGDTVYLTTAMAQCVGTKALPNAQVQSYIERVANVEWFETKSKKGTTKAFRKIMDTEESTGKKLKTVATVDELYLQETKWFDHANDLNADKPHTDADKFLAQIKSMITKGVKAQKEDRVDGDVEAFATLVEELETLVG